MKLVYVCAPFAGDVETNTRRAAEYARQIVEAGHLPIVPHLALSFLDEDTERKLALAMCIKLLELCDTMWVCGEPTAGMWAEIRHWTDFGGSQADLEFRSANDRGGNSE